MNNIMPIISLIICFLSLFSAPPALSAAETKVRKHVAEVLGKPVYEDDLIPPKAAAEQKAKLSPADYLAWYERTREETVRNLVWSAVFADFAQKRKVEPTPAEIDSQIRQTKRFMAEDKVRRQKQRQELIVELKSTGLTEAQRKQKQQYLDTLNSLRDHDARMEKEQSDPAQKKMWLDAERNVASMWVKQWKVNQALFQEFGGRIIFQQAGWEPIDAYRALLDQYKAEKRFVIHDPSLQDAVYRYFRHNFVYADEKKAKFYFERPYWERTEQEMRAAGF